MSNKKHWKINPYLMFPGNCREAMEFYKSVLNGELEVMTFEGAPMEVPGSYKDKIMHATLKFGDAFFMASDVMPGTEVVQGNAYNMTLSIDEVAEAQQVFDLLSAGGNVHMPFEDTFWGSKFGQLTDQFGINWMIDCELKQD